MHLIGRNLSIPDWVTNLRHSLAHGTGETNVDQLEAALQIVLESLISNSKNFWSHQAQVFKEKYRDLTSEEKSALRKLAEKLSSAVERSLKDKQGRGHRKLSVFNRFSVYS